MDSVMLISIVTGCPQVIDKYFDFYVAPVSAFVNWGGIKFTDGTSQSADSEVAYGAAIGMDIGFGKTFAITHFARVGVAFRFQRARFTAPAGPFRGGAIGPAWVCRRGTTESGEVRRGAPGSGGRLERLHCCALSG